jgi:hypothetical protein
LYGLGLMRIRMLRRPRETCIDGVRLDQFEPGFEYEVGSSLAALLCAEGWAEPLEPAAFDPPAPQNVFPGPDDQAFLRPPRRFGPVRERFPPASEPARAHDRPGRGRKTGRSGRGPDKRGPSK